MTEQQTAHRLAIQAVMSNYAAAVDDRDRDRYRACFHPDVEVVGFGTQTYRGVEAWTAYVWQALEKYTTTQHLLAPPLISLGNGSAEARTDVQARHVLSDGSGQRFTLWATYLSRMQLDGNHWHITRHELVVRDSQLEQG